MNWMNWNSMANILHLILNIERDLKNMGINAKITQINHSTVKIFFENLEDHNLYKLSGAFQEGKYPEHTYLMFGYPGERYI